MELPKIQTVSQSQVLSRMFLSRMTAKRYYKQDRERRYGCEGQPFFLFLCWIGCGCFCVSRSLPCVSWFKSPSTAAGPASTPSPRSVFTCANFLVRQMFTSMIRGLFFIEKAGSGNGTDSRQFWQASDHLLHSLQPALPSLSPNTTHTSSCNNAWSDPNRAGIH